MRPEGCKDRLIDRSELCVFVEISHLCNFCGSYYGCFLARHISLAFAVLLNRRTILFLISVYCNTVIQSFGVCLQINGRVT